MAAADDNNANNAVVLWKIFDGPLGAIIGGGLDERSCVRTISNTDEYEHYMDEPVPEVGLSEGRFFLLLSPPPVILYPPSLHSTRFA